jgi:hypothetical protein
MTGSVSVRDILVTASIQLNIRPGATVSDDVDHRMHPLTITLSLALLFFVFGVAGHDGTQSTPKEQPPKTHKPSPAPVKPPHKSEPKSSPKPKSTHKATSTSKSAAKPTPSSDSSPNFIM